MSASWEVDLDSYIANPGSNASPTAIQSKRATLVAAIHADHQSPDTWWAFFQHEEYLSSTDHFPPSRNNTYLFELYRWATKLIPRQGNHTKDSFVKIWIGFGRQQWMRNQDDGRDTFKTLKSQRIGQNCSAVFLEWATLEHCNAGDTYKAMSVLSKGIKEGAQPVAALETMTTELKQGGFTYRPFWKPSSIEEEGGVGNGAAPAAHTNTTTTAAAAANSNNNNKTTHSAFTACHGAFSTPAAQDERLPRPAVSQPTTLGRERMYSNTQVPAASTSSINQGGGGQTRHLTEHLNRTVHSVHSGGSSKSGNSTSALDNDNMTAPASVSHYQQRRNATITLPKYIPSNTNTVNMNRAAPDGGNNENSSGSGASGSANTTTLLSNNSSGSSAGGASISEEATVAIQSSGGGGPNSGIHSNHKASSSSTDYHHHHCNVQEEKTMLIINRPPGTIKHVPSSHRVNEQQQQQQREGSAPLPSSASKDTRPVSRAPKGLLGGGSRALRIAPVPEAEEEEQQPIVQAVHVHTTSNGEHVTGSLPAIPEQYQPQRQRQQQQVEDVAMMPPPPARVTQQVPPPAQIPPPQPQQHASRPGRRIVEDENSIVVKGIMYTKLECVGKGGSSKVYKVMAPNRKIFALKRIRFSGRDPEAASGFLDEITLLNRLRGASNIIQLIDSEVHHQEGLIYMVLECGDIDLARLLQRHEKNRRDRAAALQSSLTLGVDENFIRLYWEQMLQAVDIIHRQRIVHSDLKPANFLMVEGQLKLIDFGIAKAIQSDTTSIARESQVGTLNYMSPEAILGGSNNIRGGPPMKVGRPSDIWSLGCILYQMAYGHTPFAQLPFIQKMHAITDTHHSIHFPPLRNRALLDVIQRCLDRDPKRRITMPELLGHAFLRPEAGGGNSGEESGCKMGEEDELNLSREQLKKLLMKMKESGDDVDVEQLVKQLSIGKNMDCSPMVGVVVEAKRSKAAPPSPLRIPMPPKVGDNNNNSLKQATGGASQQQLQQQHQPISLADAAALKAASRAEQRANAIAALEQQATAGPDRSSSGGGGGGGYMARMPLAPVPMMIRQQDLVRQSAATLKKGRSLDVVGGVDQRHQHQSNGGGGLEDSLRRGVEKFQFDVTMHSSGDATNNTSDFNMQ
jgi:serine/threonine-protein kinase TTK/MPS1